MSFKLIALTETWLTDSVFNSELFPDCYNVIRRDRNFATTGRSRGGGVLLAISNSLKYSLIDTSNLSNLVPLIDLVMCRSIFGKTKFIVCIVYVPPDVTSSDLELFLNALEVLLLDEEVILIGDFNVHNFSKVASTVCPKTSILQQFCNTLSLSQHNSILNTNQHLLDLVFLNSDKFKINIEHCDSALVPEDSHHPSLLINLDIASDIGNHKFPSANIKRYNLKKNESLKTL